MLILKDSIKIGQAS